MKRVWFNQGMALTDDVVNTIAAVGDKNLCLLTSHSTMPESKSGATSFAEAKAALGDEEYVAWCLATAQKRRVDLFVPGRASIAVAGHLGQFTAAGIKVMLPGSQDVMLTIQHKTRLYQRLEGTSVPIPQWRLVNTLASLETAYGELRQGHESVCFKPATGVFAHGFRRIVEGGSALERLMKGGPYTATSEIGMDEVRMIFGERDFDDLMVMQYLNGVERSVDCIAQNGRLVACIIRLKSGHDVQVMEANDLIESYIDEISQRLNLSGVFNVQFKEHDGTPYLLEINSRPSGGLHKACLATGFPLPYWAVRLSLGLCRAEDVPQPNTGMAIVRRKTYEIIQ